MHHVVRQHLEEYLHDASDPRVPSEVHAHVESCEECRGELRHMRTQAVLIRSLRSAEESELAPGFYALVVDRIEAQRGASVWSVFLEPAFGRRLVFACLALVVLLGAYMISTEPQGTLTAGSPEVMLAVEPHPYELNGSDRQQDREKVLVTLATYREQ